MLGTYRLCLALLVALGHTGVLVAGLKPGVIAVVGFYLISGYVMTGLLRTHYAAAGRVGSFYLDRALRLMPHYLVIVAIALAWYAATGTHTDYIRRQPGVGDVIENLLVVPMNFYMYNNSDGFALIPPSWSLGAEMQFYLVVPAILLAGTIVRPLAIVASVAVYLCAAFGLLNTDWFGYRLLPGVLFLFMLGSVLYDLHHSDNRRRYASVLVGTVIALAAVVALLLGHAGKILWPYNRETLIGLVIGIVVVNALAPRARNAIDDALGNLSYGVFLNHFLVQWTLFGGNVGGFGATVAYIGASLAIAFILYQIVERPVLDIRRGLRRTPPGRSSRPALQIARR